MVISKNKQLYQPNELKTVLPDELVELCLENRCGSAIMPQVRGSLTDTDPLCDLPSYDIE